MSGNSVRLLQVALNNTPETQIAETGDGSPGNETEYFGKATLAAVIKYQEIHADEVLAPVGLSAGTGIVGARTRALLNKELAGVASASPASGSSVPNTATDAAYKAMQDRINAITDRFNSGINKAIASATVQVDAASSSINAAQKALDKIDATTKKLENFRLMINADGSLNQAAVNKFVSVALIIPTEPFPGDQIRIFGSGFVAPNTIHLGNKTFIASGTSTGGVLLTATIPSGISAGSYDFSIENAQGKSESVPLTISGNTIASASTSESGQKPEIVSIQPNEGSLSSRITVYGKNFSPTNTIITTAGLAMNVPSSDGKTISFSLSTIDKEGAAVEDISPGATLRMIVRNENGVSNVKEFTIR
jgi:hypothetical protein